MAISTVVLSAVVNPVHAGAWLALSSGVDGESEVSVNALVIDSAGNLVAGGHFLTAGGIYAICVAKWDGHSWSSLNYHLGYDVHALALDRNGNLYAGGSFRNPFNPIPSYISMYNGNSWSPLGSGVDDCCVDALATDSSGNLYVGGSFTNAGGISTRAIAKWNGHSWSALGSGLDDSVSALVRVSSTKLYAGGNIMDPEVGYRCLAKWNGSSWSYYYLPPTLWGIDSLAFDSLGNLYIGGPSGNKSVIMKWDGDTWITLGEAEKEYFAYVYALACDSVGNLYAGGIFTKIDDIIANNIACWNGHHWSALGHGMNGHVYALTVDRVGNVYAGGYFTEAGGISASRVAKWDWAQSTATPTPRPSPTAQPSPTPLIHGIDSGDYSGDGLSDIAIFRPAQGLWSIRDITRVYFGSSGDLPISGDFNNDGKTEMAIFRESSGLWSVFGITRFYFGSSNDIPVPGDYDGDGFCDAGVFRASQGLWSVAKITRVYLGQVGDIPVPGYYSNERRMNIAIFRPPSGLWSVRELSRFYFGRIGDYPLTMDYAGDEGEQATIFRGSNGLWSIRNVTHIYMGTAGDIPISGAYRRLPCDEPTIFRPSSGYWGIKDLTRAYFGQGGDLPATGRPCWPVTPTPTPSLTPLPSATRALTPTPSATPSVYDPTPTPLPSPSPEYTYDLQFSTYLGGSGKDVGCGVCADSSGNIYLTGYSVSNEFPTLNPYQPSRSGSNINVIVSGLSPSGLLLFSTYLGGDTDTGRAITVDNSDIYVTGETRSSNFPTVNAYQATKNGSYDCFIAKLASSGSELLSSTYLGGSQEDYSYAISASQGTAFIVGRTSSADFPTASCYQPSYAGGIGDAYVLRLSSTGSSIMYSTYLGGSEFDEGNGIALDSADRAHIVGITPSYNFPTLNPYQSSLNSSTDVFISIISSTGSAVEYSTYFGGSKNDQGYGLAISLSGNIAITGATNSMDFPTLNSYQGTLSGDFDSFLSELSSSGTELLYSTYLGGTGYDVSYSISSASDDCAYIAGYTASNDFPTAEPLQAGHGGGQYDGYIARFESTGPEMMFCSYLGGSDLDGVRGIAVAESALIVTGETSSYDFPTACPYQNSCAGDRDVYVSKMRSIRSPQ